MDHQADVGLVYAHTKGYGGGDNGRFVMDELLLVFLAHGVVQAGVIGQGLQSPCRQVGCQVFGVFAGKAVYDGGLAIVLPQKLQKGIEGPGLGPDCVVEIGAVEAGDESLSPVEAKLGDNILADPFRGRGGEGNHRHVGKVLTQALEVAVVGAEVVSPFGDAMGLVNCYQADVEVLQEGPEPRQGQPLRGQVEDFEPAIYGLDLHPGNLVVGKGTVDELRRDAVGFQGVNLVLHQGDEGRDHQAEPIETQRRQLVAQGLAAAGGHQYQGIPTGKDVVDHLFLQGKKLVVAEMRLQDAEDMAVTVHNSKTPGILLPYRIGCHPLHGVVRNLTPLRCGE